MCCCGVIQVIVQEVLLNRVIVLVRYVMLLQVLRFNSGKRSVGIDRKIINQEI